MLCANSGAFPCEPGHVTGPVGTRGGVRAEGSRLPLGTRSSGPLKAAGSCVWPWCPVGKCPWAEGETTRRRLRAEVGKAQKKERVHVLACSTNSLLEGKRERQRRPGKSVSFLPPPLVPRFQREPSIPWPPGFPRPWAAGWAWGVGVSAGRLSPQVSPVAPCQDEVTAVTAAARCPSDPEQPTQDSARASPGAVRITFVHGCGSGVSRAP